MSKTIKISRTTSYDHDTFNTIVDITEKTGDSFNEVVNDLIRKGLERRDE